MRKVCFFGPNFLGLPGKSLKQRAWANSNKEPDPMDRVPHPQTPYMGISEWYLMPKFMLVNKTYPRGKPSLFTSNTEQTLNRHSGNYTSRWRKMKVCDVTSYKYLSHPQTTRRIYQNCRPNDRLKNWVECLTTQSTVSAYNWTFGPCFSPPQKIEGRYSDNETIDLQ